MYEGERYTIEVTDKSSSWGNGVKLSLYKSNGDLFSSISYLCHPEQEKFDEFQLKTISELEEIALSRLSTDMDTKNFKLATESGIGLLLPINNE
jgi:hypothetical protein